MNKSLIITVIAVVVLGFGGYAAYNSMQTKPSTNINTSQINVNTAAEINTNVEANTNVNVAVSVTKESLKGFLASGKVATCTIDQTTEKGRQTGTTYFANGHMRGDLNITDNVKGNYMFHVISDGSTSYMWGGPLGEKTGLIIKTNTNANVNSTASTNQGIDMDTPMDISCTPWTVDSSLLTPPSDVKFQDIANMFGGAKTSTDPNTKIYTNVNGNDDCAAACDSMSESLRAECRRALGC